jgi:SAM-dependent methyltransferase
MGDFLLAEDLRRGGDAVMGVGGLTQSLVEAAGQDSPGAVLDLGCGAGGVALALASRATRVVATDINPRALALTRANAAMRGVTNIETRVGDLFAPVAGERFDSILSQPPFLPNWRGASYAESGERGDELIARLLREITNQLSPDGVAAIVASLPVVDGHPIESWVAAAVADELNVLVVDRGQTDLDGFAVGVSAHEHPTFGPAFDEAALTRRAHFDRMRISELRDVMLVLSPAREKRFAGTFELSRAPHARCTRRDLVSLTRSYALCARGHEALAAARVRLRPGVELARLADGSALVDSGEAPIQLPGMGPEMCKLVEALRAGKPVGETIRKLTSHPSSHGARPGMFAGAEQLLRVGLLEVAG